MSRVIRGARRATLIAVLAVLGPVACAPEVGSERWCEAMKRKPRGDWSVNEAADFARHCIFR